MRFHGSLYCQGGTELISLMYGGAHDFGRQVAPCTSAQERQPKLVSENSTLCLGRRPSRAAICRPARRASACRRTNTPSRRTGRRTGTRRGHDAHHVHALVPQVRASASRLDEAGCGFRMIASVHLASDDLDARGLAGSRASPRSSRSAPCSAFRSSASRSASAASAACQAIASLAACPSAPLRPPATATGPARPRPARRARRSTRRAVHAQHDRRERERPVVRLLEAHLVGGALHRRARAGRITCVSSSSGCEHVLAEHVRDRASRRTRPPRSHARRAVRRPGTSRRRRRAAPPGSTGGRCGTGRSPKIAWYWFSPSTAKQRAPPFFRQRTPRCGSTSSAAAA